MARGIGAAESRPYKEGEKQPTLPAVGSLKAGHHKIR